MMGGGVRDVVIRFGAKVSPQVRTSVGQVNRDLDSVATSSERSTRRGARAWVGFGVKVAAGVAAGVAAVTGAGLLIGRRLVDLGSDAEETVSKVGVIFGPGAKQIEAYAARAAQAIGQTSTAAMNAAATFATFGKGAGMTGKPLADWSTRMVTLSSDLASFYNADPSEVVEAIGAALRGEAEPMRRFGVLMDDAALRAQALKMGIIKTTKEALSPQQKVLAAQALILAQTKDAQGDFARTSGGFANQQRIFSAAVEESKIKLGKGLLPVATRIITFLNTTGLPAIQRITDRLGGMGRGVEGMRSRFDRARPTVERIASGFMAAGRGVADFGRMLDRNTRGPLIEVGKAFQNLRDTVLPIVRDVADYVSENWGEWGPQMQEVGEQMTRAIGGGLKLIAAIWNRASQGISYAWRRWGDGILRTTGTVFGWMLKMWSGAFQTLGGITRTVAAIINGDWAKAGEGLKSTARGIWRVVVSVFNIQSTLLRPITSRVIGYVVGIFRWGRNEVLGAARGTVTGVVGLWSWATGKVIGRARAIRDGVISWLTSLRAWAFNLSWSLTIWVAERWGWLQRSVVASARYARNGVVSWFTSLRTWAIGLASTATQWVADRWGWLQRSATASAKYARNGVVGWFVSLYNGVRAYTGSVTGWARDRWQDFANAMSRIGKGMATSLEAPFKFLLSNIKGPLREVASWLNRYVMSPMNAVTSKFGVNIPQLPKFHTGGVVPGRAETPIMAMGGEGVLTPKATKAMGGAKGIQALNAGGPIDWLKRRSSDWLSAPGEWAAQAAAKGARWAIDALFSRVPNVASIPPAMAGQLMSGMMATAKSAALQWATSAGSSSSTTGDFTLSRVGIGSGPWRRPLASYSIGVPIWGYPNHTGQDFPSREGNPVHAASDGVVSKAARLLTSYGIHAFIDHYGGTQTRYAHMSRMGVGVGQRVKAGDVIGAVGSTGNSSGPHLHFETRQNGAVLNPISFMAARGVKFDSGGWLEPGTTVVQNNTGSPEAVLTGEQFDRLIAALQESTGARVVIDGESVDAAIRRNVKVRAGSDVL